MLIYFIIALVVAVLALVLFIYGIHFGDFETCTIVSFILVVVALVLLWVGYGIDNARFKEKLQAAKNDSSITWYLDGEIVDVENIDLNQYECSFNEDETKVFVTKR